MDSLWKKYCEESTMHGFMELFHSKSLFSKIFWILIITGGSIMTSFQIYLVVINLNSNPTKTQISTLEKGGVVVYTPYSITAEHFIHWVNLSKVNEMGFEYETFLYAMSYYQKVYSAPFNVAETNDKLKKIMKKYGIKNLFDLLLSFAVDVPYNIKTSVPVPVKPLLSRLAGGKTKFVSVMNDLQKNETFAQGNFININFELFTNFSQSLFNKQLQQLYHYNLTDEYEMYNFGGTNTNDTKPINVHFNPSGKENMFMELDFNSFDYEYYMKGTSYEWMSLPDKPCQHKDKFNFYVECEYQCTLTYNNLSVCELYFTSDDTGNLNKDLNQCTFDKTLVTVSGSEEEYMECIKECTDACTEWGYEFSQVLYPRAITQDSGPILGLVTMTFDDPKNVLVVATVPSFTWDDAIANIGGLLGLWVGGSIMSFIQILYIWCCYPLETKWLQRHLVSIDNAKTDQTKY